MPPAESVDTDRLGRWPRLVVCLLALLMVAHAALLALWLAPKSPVRDAVGGSFLSSYVDPYFQQGDDSLGIGSNRVDESLQIRAWVKATPDGKAEKTDWIDVTAIETAELRGDLTAPRSHQSARRLAASLNLAMLQFDEPQLDVIAEIDQDTLSGQVRQQLLGAGGSPLAVRNFLGADEMARRYASLWLHAMVGDGQIVAVAYRVGRRVAPGADDGGSATLNGRAFTWFDMGSRSPYRGTPEARAAFKDYVEGRDG